MLPALLPESRPAVQLFQLPALLPHEQLSLLLVPLPPVQLSEPLASNQYSCASADQMPDSDQTLQALVVQDTPGFELVCHPRPNVLCSVAAFSIAVDEKTAAYHKLVEVPASVFAVSIVLY